MKLINKEKMESFSSKLWEKIKEKFNSSIIDVSYAPDTKQITVTKGDTSTQQVDMSSLVKEWKDLSHVSVYEKINMFDKTKVIDGSNYNSSGLIVNSDSYYRYITSVSLGEQFTLVKKAHDSNRIVFLQEDETLVSHTGNSGESANGWVYYHITIPSTETISKFGFNIHKGTNSIEEIMLFSGHVIPTAEFIPFMSGASILVDSSNIKYSFDGTNEGFTENTVDAAVKELGKKVDDNIRPKKSFIICIAGQSNAVGYDESPITNLNKNLNENRIRQLGIYGTDNLKNIPLDIHAHSFQNMLNVSGNGATHPRGTKGLHLPLGNLLLNEIPDDYEILFISATYGGTGFTVGSSFGSYNQDTMLPSSGALKWGVESAYYQSMRDRIKYALDLNPENIFGGLIWIQGEFDYARPNEHYPLFQAMTEDFFTYFNSNNYGSRTINGTWDKDLWYNVETTSYWYSGNNDCTPIWNNYKNWNQNTYVEIPRDTDTNTLNGTGATSSNRPTHFGNDAYTKVIAPRILNKMKENGVKFNHTFNHVESQATNILGFDKEQDPRKFTATIDNLEAYGENSTFSINNGELSFTDTITAYSSNIKIKSNYNINFEVAKGYYWLVFRGDFNSKISVIGIGGNRTGVVSTINIDTNSITSVGNLSSEIEAYSFNIGDRLSIYLDNNKILYVHLKKKLDDTYNLWFKFDTTRFSYTSSDIKMLGFTFGYSSAETSLLDENIVLKDIVIQKEKGYINNNYLDEYIHNTATQVVKNYTGWGNLEYIDKTTSKNLFNPEGNIIFNHYYNGDTLIESSTWNMYIFPITLGKIYTIYEKQYDSAQISFLDENKEYIDRFTITNTNQSSTLYSSRRVVNTQNAGNYSTIKYMAINKLSTRDTETDLMIFEGELTHSMNKYVPNSRIGRYLIDSDCVTMSFDNTDTGISSDTINDAVTEISNWEGMNYKAKTEFTNLIYGITPVENAYYHLNGNAVTYSGFRGYKIPCSPGKTYFRSSKTSAYPNVHCAFFSGEDGDTYVSGTNWDFSSNTDLDEYGNRIGKITVPKDDSITYMTLSYNNAQSANHGANQMVYESSVRPLSAYVESTGEGEIRIDTDRVNMKFKSLTGLISDNIRDALDELNTKSVTTIDIATEQDINDILNSIII